MSSCFGTWAWRLELRPAPRIPVIHSTPPHCLALPEGLRLVLYSLLVCLLKDQDGLNLVWTYFSKSCLVSSDDRPGIPVLASCVYYSGVALKAVVCFLSCWGILSFLNMKSARPFGVSVFSLITLLHHVRKITSILLTNLSFFNY